MPDPVTGLTLTLATSGTSVRASWDESGGTLIGYQLQRKPFYSIIQGGWQDYYFTVYDGTNTSYTDDIDTTGYVTPGTSFTYRVRAYNAAGAGSWSTEQSISWTY